MAENTSMPADTNIPPERQQQQPQPSNEPATTTTTTTTTTTPAPAQKPAHPEEAQPMQYQQQQQAAEQPQPGPRATRLHQVYTKALQATLRANSYANFAACFPTPAQHASRSLESVWRQLNGKLEQSAQAEFEDILRERETVRGLNELDRLVGEARERREKEGEGDRVPPHTLPPDELHRAHLAPYLIKTKEKLDEQIKSVETQNIALSETVMRQRQQIQQLFAGLDSVVDDLEAAAKATAQFGQETKLREEAEEVHAQNIAMPPL